MNRGRKLQRGECNRLDFRLDRSKHGDKLEAMSDGAFAYWLMDSRARR